MISGKKEMMGLRYETAAVFLLPFFGIN